MLLRRFTVLKDKGRKLETRWEGPYRVARITKSGVSTILEDQTLAQECYTRVALVIEVRGGR